MRQRKAKSGISGMRRILDVVEGNATGVTVLSSKSENMIDVQPSPHANLIFFSMDDKTFLVHTSAIDGLIEGLARAKARVLEAA
jgi:hypothetical protein